MSTQDKEIQHMWPVLGSEEFYAKWYPNISDSTKAIYRRLINSLETSGSDVSDWMNEKRGNPYRWKERFLLLRKFNGIYWTFDVEKYNGEYVAIMEEMNNGENLVVTESNSNDSLLTTFNELDEKFDWNRKFNVTKDMLFGCWLPPRRMDVYELIIRKSPLPDDDRRNYYDQSSNMFVFHNYKNSKYSGVTKIGIMSLAPLYENKELFFRIVKYLNSLPAGELYPQKSKYAIAKKSYGVSNAVLRKYWVSKINICDKKQRLILSKWMDHSLDTAAKHYLIEATKPSVEDEDTDYSWALGGDPIQPVKENKSDLIDFTSFGDKFDYFSEQRMSDTINFDKINFSSYIRL